MKQTICSFFGGVGSIIAAAFGGWDTAIGTLFIFMGIDYISGLIVAGVFHKSKKSENGSLSSAAGWKGLCKKGMMLFFVLIGTRIDVMLGTTYMRDGVCIAFIVNELISIIENATLMGVPIPTPITKAIDMMQKKGE